MIITMKDIEELKIRIGGNMKRKVAIIDIDGVLNYYPQTQLDFFNNTLHTNYRTLMEAKEGLSYNNYKKMKEMYRNSEYKHDAKPREGAKEFLEELRHRGYFIYIITARQLFKGNMLQKTIEWLQKNELIYDYIYCTTKKDFTIFEKFGNIDLVVEDNSDNLNNIEEITKDRAYYFLMHNNDNEKNGNIKYSAHYVWNFDEIREELGWNDDKK